MYLYLVRIFLLCLSKKRHADTMNIEMPYNRNEERLKGIIKIGLSVHLGIYKLFHASVIDPFSFI